MSVLRSLKSGSPISLRGWTNLRVNDCVFLFSVASVCHTRTLISSRRRSGMSWTAVLLVLSGYSKSRCCLGMVGHAHIVPVILFHPNQKALSWILVVLESFTVMLTGDYVRLALSNKNPINSTTLQAATTTPIARSVVIFGNTYAHIRSPSRCCSLCTCN